MYVLCSLGSIKLSKSKASKVQEPQALEWVNTLASILSAIFFTFFERVVKSYFILRRVRQVGWSDGRAPGVSRPTETQQQLGQ